MVFVPSFEFAYHYAQAKNRRKNDSTVFKHAIEAFPSTRTSSAAKPEGTAPDQSLSPQRAAGRALLLQAQIHRATILGIRDAAHQSFLLQRSIIRVIAPGSYEMFFAQPDAQSASLFATEASTISCAAVMSNCNNNSRSNACP
jgi:hypothetical protein